MTQTLGTIGRKIKNATELQSVVQTMKTLAAVNIGIYEKVDQAVTEYYQTIELGLVAILRQYHLVALLDSCRCYETGAVGIVVFGSDQGMVGSFNEHLVPIVLGQTGAGDKKIVWPVGERIGLKLQDGQSLEKIYRVPDSVNAITELVDQLILDIVVQQEACKFKRLVMIYNQPISAANYKPVVQQLLPVDPKWINMLARQPWPTTMAPQVIPEQEDTMRFFFQEYLFITLCRACADSLISENISRLIAMQRADENITNLLQILNTDYNQARQTAITEELFDVIFGYDTLMNKEKKHFSVQ